MQARARVALLAMAVLALPLLSGCLDNMADYRAFDPDLYYENPVVREGEYHFGNLGSMPLTGGEMRAQGPETVYLVSDLPAHDADTGEASRVLIPMAIWRPANATEKVPIILDAGPYYEQNEVCMEYNQDQTCKTWKYYGISDPQQRTEWLIGSFLPHGYAVVQLGVRGTGTAGGCMDLLGDAETHDIVQAIDWMATQDWANGNVAMIGASYDGSTQWSVAATGNEHLKAIVPTASLPDIFDLMFHNGSAEYRGAIMHSLVYWGFGFDDDFPQNPGLPPEVPWPEPGTLPPVGSANGRTMQQDLQNLCPEAMEGTVLGPYSTATGDRMASGTDYWTQRDHRQGVLDNYKGAVFLIHGLQDWNVDPHSTVPYNVALRESGIDVTEWFGQWGHAYPDSACAKDAPVWVTTPCRLDFADELLHWFDRHLKGMDGPSEPRIQVQDSLGFWRYTDSYPPTDAVWQELRLTGDGALRAEASGEVAIQLDPPMLGSPAKVLELKTEPLATDTRLSGLPQLKLPFQVQAAGGELAFWLFDEDADGKVRAINAYKDLRGEWRANDVDVPVIGHGSMNLRYYAGGEEAQVLQPNTRYVAQMEFEPLETVVPAGHRLTLWVFQFSYPDHSADNNVAKNGPALSTTAPITVYLGADSVLRLPVVETDYTKVFPVPGSHLPTIANMSRMYVYKPAFMPVPPAMDLVTVPTAVEAATAATQARSTACSLGGCL